MHSQLLTSIFNEFLDTIIAKYAVKLRKYGRYSAVVKVIKCNATIGNVRGVSES